MTYLGDKFLHIGAVTIVNNRDNALHYVNKEEITSQAFLVNFPFLDGDVPRRASYGVYISQLIRFARKVQVGKDQEKAQSDKDSHSKNRGGKNQTNNQVLVP